MELFQNKVFHPSTAITTDTQLSLSHVSLSGLILPAPDRLLTLGVGKLTVMNFYFINALFLLDLKYGGGFNAAAARRLGHLLAPVVYRAAARAY